MLKNWHSPRQGAALIPYPRIHLTRFHGCLAPHAKIRSEVVPKKEELDIAENSVVNQDVPDDKKQRSKKMTWAKLLSRTFGIDTSHCSKCGGEMKILSAILEVSVIRSILTHMGLPSKPPDIAPARFPSQMSFI